MVKGSWIKPGAVVIDCGINVKPGKMVRMERKWKECSDGKGKGITKEIIW